MNKSLALYEPNYNVIPGTTEFWLNQQKYVRLCCYLSSGRDEYTRNINLMYVDWSYLTDYYLTDFGYGNFARQYYYKVKMQVPRNLTPK